MILIDMQSIPLCTFNILFDWHFHLLTFICKQAAASVVC